MEIFEFLKHFDDPGHCIAIVSCLRVRSLSTNITSTLTLPGSFVPVVISKKTILSITLSFVFLGRHWESWNRLPNPPTWMKTPARVNSNRKLAKTKVLILSPSKKCAWEMVKILWKGSEAARSLDKRNCLEMISLKGSYQMSYLEPSTVVLRHVQRFS